MAANGTLGSKLFITDAAIAAGVDTEAEFTAQDWTEIGLIESFGEFGRVFAPVNFQAVADGRMYKLKGGFDDGNLQITVGQDLSDAGQSILSTGANSSTQDNYGFKVELNDPPTDIGGPTTFFFRGLPMSYRTQMGSVNSVIKALTTIEVNSPIIPTLPAELYDRFITGSALTAYDLFKGSDAQAAFPVITSNALVSVTGDAGTGFAADGSQLIYDTAFVLSAGAVHLEARIKLSAITNVQVFFGLTDQKASLENPITASGVSNGVTTNATDAVGFMFDTGMSTDNIWLVGVNNDSDKTPQNSALAFAANTYRTLRIDIAANGSADFYIDGAHIGSTMTTACRTNVNLYPTIAIAATNTASRTGTSDYLYLRQD